MRWFPLSASQKLRCITPRCARRVGATPFPSDRSACMRRNALPDSEDGPPEDDSSWTQELSIFKARKNKPSQLASLRNYQAASVSKGNVVAVRSSIAVVEGLNNDAEVGTSLKFGTGDVTGVLLWRRDDNTVFALVNDDDRSSSCRRIKVRVAITSRAWTAPGATERPHMPLISFLENGCF